MKKILLYSILLSSTLHAESMEKQTLLQANAQHGGYVGLAVKLARVDEARYGMYGFRFGWIVNRSFGLGAAYYNMVSNFTHYDIYAPDAVQPPGNARYYTFETHHGGMELHYILFPDKQIHFAVSSLMGIGHVRYVAVDAVTVLSDDRHLFVEPALNVHLNVSDHVKLGIGFSYMIAAGIKATGLKNNSLSGFTLTAFGAVGIF